MTQIHTCHVCLNWYEGEGHTDALDCYERVARQLDAIDAQRNDVLKRLELAKDAVLKQGARP